MAAENKAGVGGARLTLPVGARDHVRGEQSAAVTLVQYGDFECPQCMRAFPVVQQLREAFGAQLRFVYRHFPLTNVHHHAQRAAEASEWAAATGLFWPMHDGLYESAGRLTDVDLLVLAERLGQRPASLQQAWAAHTFLSRVKEDFLSGLSSGVGGTPTFFVNGALHEGGSDLEALTRVIEQARAD